jgi:hypothetical protein
MNIFERGNVVVCIEADGRRRLTTGGKYTIERQDGTMVTLLETGTERFWSSRFRLDNPLPDFAIGSLRR